jgi:hypothetical protein
MAAIIMQGRVKKQVTIAYFVHYFAQAVPNIKQKRTPEGCAFYFGAEQQLIYCGAI